MPNSAPYKTQHLMKYIPGPDLTPVDRNASKTHPRSPRSPSLTFSSHCSTTGKSNSLSRPADRSEWFPSQTAFIRGSFWLGKKKRKRIITFLQGFFLHERQRQASNNTQQHESWLLRYSLMSNPCRVFVNYSEDMTGSLLLFSFSYTGVWFFFKHLWS